MFTARVLLPVIAISVAGCASDPAGPTDRPPVILEFRGSPGPLSPGDLVTFDFVLRDSTLGKKFLSLRFDGSFTAVHNFEIETTDAVSAWYIRVPLPSHADPRQSALARLSISNEAGLSDEAATSVSIWDIVRPAATMSLGGLRADQTISPGQPLDLYVNASDNHQLTYIGWAGDGRRDSVPASGTGDSHTFRITIPARWIEPRPRLTAWARDPSGNESTIEAFEVPVFDWTTYPTVSVPLAENPRVSGLLWDSRREVSYLLRGRRIDVVSSTGAIGAPIPLPGSAETFTFTESGDSIVVTLREERSLGIVDLRSPVPAVSVVPLTSDGTARAPRMAATSGSHLFVAWVAHGELTRILDIDLAAGTQTNRTDFDSTFYYFNPALFRLPDGRAFLTPQCHCDTGDRYIYSADTDRWVRTPLLRGVLEATYSGSPSGRFMLSNSVYDASHNLYRVVEKQDWKEAVNVQNTAALSADGNSVFLGTSYGIAHFDLDAVPPRAQIRLEAKPQHLIATPDGSKLLAVIDIPGSPANDQALKIISIR